MKSINELDIIFISYDEPNAEQNYADLCAKVPWAKRVHGVKGSDSAHKACAELSETDRFITIDGDNRIRPNFLNQEINFEEHTDLQSCVISWAGKNIVNGLMYGNGGIKCWPKDFVLKIINSPVSLYIQTTPATFPFSSFKISKAICIRPRKSGTSTST